MHPIVLSIFFILVFGIVFLLNGEIFLNVDEDGIKKYSIEEIFEKDTTTESNIRITTGRMKQIEEPVSTLDYFKFSMETFTSGLTSFLYPSTTYEPEGKMCKYIAIFERLLGTLLVAIFFYTYGKKIRRG